MKSKSAIIPIAILSVLGIGIIAFFVWLFWGDITRTLTRLSRFGALTSAEQGCAQNIAGDLIYIEKQKDNNTVAIGYFANDDYYVVLYSADAQGHCNIVFQEKAWPLDALYFAKKINCSQWQSKRSDSVVISPRMCMFGLTKMKADSEVRSTFSLSGSRIVHTRLHLL